MWCDGKNKKGEFWRRVCENKERKGVKTRKVNGKTDRMNIWVGEKIRRLSQEEKEIEEKNEKKWGRQERARIKERGLKSNEPKIAKKKLFIKKKKEKKER